MKLGIYLQTKKIEYSSLTTRTMSTGPKRAVYVKKADYLKLREDIGSLEHTKEIKKRLAELENDLSVAIDRMKIDSKKLNDKFEL